MAESGLHDPVLESCQATPLPPYGGSEEVPNQRGQSHNHAARPDCRRIRQSGTVVTTPQPMQQKQQRPTPRPLASAAAPRTALSGGGADERGQENALCAGRHPTSTMLFPEPGHSRNGNALLRLACTTSMSVHNRACRKYTVHEGSLGLRQKCPVYSSLISCGATRFETACMTRDGPRHPNRILRMPCELPNWAELAGLSFRRLQLQAVAHPNFDESRPFRGQSSRLRTWWGNFAPRN